MPYRLEIALKPHWTDAEGETIRRKAQNYFGIHLDKVRTIQILTMDATLDERQRETIRQAIFTNPVTHESSWTPLAEPFDQMIWVGYRSGVRDNPGSTAVEAIEDVLNLKLAEDEAVYTSKRYCLTGKALSRQDAARIAKELLANDIIQQWKLFSPSEWNPQEGIGFILPKVMLQRQPAVNTISVDTPETLARISAERSLSLNPSDIPTICNYFKNPEIVAERSRMGLGDPTDIELEYISQARSDHCNHNTFQGIFHYTDEESGKTRTIQNLFNTYIKQPTLALKEKHSWVVSVLWDNAGVAVFDENHNYVITGETHNSPSNMEAYGGAITGIVGVYRDPMGTGLGSRLIMGSYGFCVGPRDYDGPLQPHLHRKRPQK